MRPAQVTYCAVRARLRVSAAAEHAPGLLRHNETSGDTKCCDSNTQEAQHHAPSPSAHDKNQAGIYRDALGEPDPFLAA